MAALETLLDFNLEYAHDASASWNGYIYQGKIALIVALEKILELGPDNCENYSLELEWLDDFAIKNGSQYISIHQVKAKAETAFSKYSPDIGILIAKALSVFPAYQLVKVIGLTGLGSNEEKKERQKSNHKKILDFLRENAFIDANGRFDPSRDANPDFSTLSLEGYSCEDLASKRNNLNDLYTTICKQAAAFLSMDSLYFHTSASIKDGLKNAIDSDSKPAPWQKIGIHLHNNFDDVAAKVKPYQYKVAEGIEKDAITTQEANDYLQTLIVKFLEADPNLAWYSTNPEHIKLVSSALGMLIQNHIEERRDQLAKGFAHVESISSDGNPISIGFEQVLSVLKGPIDEKLYYSYFLWESFHGVVHEQISGLTNDKKKLQIGRLLNKIQSTFFGSGIFDFLELIRPDIQPSNNGLASTFNYGGDDNKRRWKRVFLRFFKEVNKQIDSWNFSIKEDKNLYYFVSALEIVDWHNPEDYEEEIENIKSNIDRAASSTETYRRDFMIGGFGEGFDIALKEILPREKPTEQDIDLASGTVRRANASSEMNSEDRITHPGNVRLIDYRLAVERINALREDEIDT